VADAIRPGAAGLVGLSAITWLAGREEAEPIWLVLGAAGVGLLVAWLVG